MFQKEAKACLFLVVLVAIAFGRTLWYPFFIVDDPSYVTANLMVRSGLNWQSFLWACTTFNKGNWAPITWLSLMLDNQIGGLSPAVFHLANLIFHSISVVLLYLFFGRLGISRKVAIFAAALFAVHPLSVEPVVWISSRKDVLAGFFLTVCLHSYLTYRSNPSFRKYFWVLCTFFLGLGAKSSLVMLPVALVLLDIVLNYGKDKRQVRLILLEKVPLLLLSGLFVALTIRAQSEIGAMTVYEPLSLKARILSAAFYIFVYLRDVIWPTALVFPYPIMEASISDGVCSIIALGLVSIGAIALVKKQPMVAFGWFWFLFMTIPYLQIARVGFQVIADRWAYLPSIGIYLVMGIAIKTFSEICQIRFNWAKYAIFCIPVMVYFLFGIVQVGYWRSSETMLERAIRLYEPNPIGHAYLASVAISEENLQMTVDEYRKAWQQSRQAHMFQRVVRWLSGQDRAMEALNEIDRLELLSECYSAYACREKGEILSSLAKFVELKHEVKKRWDIDASEKATVFFEKAKELDHNDLHLLVLMANVSFQEDDLVSAEGQLKLALALGLKDPALYNYLGAVCLKTKRYQEALHWFDMAILDTPSFIEAYSNKATALFLLGRCPEALKISEPAYFVEDTSAALNIARGNCFLQQRKFAEAASSFETVLRLNPSSKESLNGLGVAYYYSGRLVDAQRILKKTLEAYPNQAELWLNLGAVLKALGQIDEAKRALSKALEISPSVTEAQEMLATLDKH